jgi:hypothetical protein
MTDFRALCARMADELDHYRQLLMDDRRETHALAAEARAALAQPEPQDVDPWPMPGDAEGLAEVFWGRYDQPEPQGPTDEEPTDQEIEEWADAAAEVPLEEMDPEVHGWRRCFKSDEFSETIRAALARWGRPAIEPVPKREDVHYAWELHDAEGEWQAGGSANSLDDVQREGNRYLQTYAADGPHKLIIERHCVTTIEPVPKQEGEQ